MRKLLIGALLGLTALVAAACNGSGSSSPTMSPLESLPPLESPSLMPSESMPIESASPLESPSLMPSESISPLESPSDLLESPSAS